MAEATTPTSNPLAKALRRFTAPEPDWREIEEALLASDVGLVATNALIKAARDGDGISGRERVRAAALNLLVDGADNLHNDADVVLLV
ncbi:MAG: signal recognition particle receptor subunit alpha, partial [Candidatus Limnocylindrus sp.]